MLAAALGIGATISWGALTDRVGRRPVYILGTIVTAAWGIPLFLLVNTGTAVLIVVTFVVSYAVCQNSLAGVQGAWFPSSSPPAPAPAAPPWPTSSPQWSLDFPR